MFSASRQVGRSGGLPSPRSAQPIARRPDAEGPHGAPFLLNAAAVDAGTGRRRHESACATAGPLLVDGEGLARLHRRALVMSSTYTRAAMDLAEFAFC